MRRNRTAVLLLFLLLCSASFADVTQGTVQSPVTKLPGAFSVSFPASTQVRARDVFEVHRGDRILGEAIVIEVNGSSAVLMPKVGFNGTMSHGDTAVFLRHAVEASAIPDAAQSSGGTAYRAFSQRIRLRMISPRRKGNLIFENPRVQIKFDVTANDLLYVDIRNKRDEPAKIDWTEIRLYTTDGHECLGIPVKLVGNGTFRRTSTILGGDSLTDGLCAVALVGNKLSVEPLIASLQPGDEPKEFGLHLVIHYPSHNFDQNFRFDVAIVEQQSFLGLDARGATEEEKDNLPSQYHEAGVVTQVLPNGPAWKAGILLGDEVVAVDGVAIQSMAAFRAMMGRKAAGEKVRFTIIRKGQIQDIDVIMATTR